MLGACSTLLPRHAHQQLSLRPQQGCNALIAAAAILQRQLTTSSSSSSSSTPFARSGTALQLLCHQSPQGLAAWGQLQHCSNSLPSLLMRPSSSSSSGSMFSASSESAMEREAARQEESRRARMRKAVQHEFRSPTLGLLWDKYKREPPIWQAGVLPNPIKTYRHIARWIRGRAMTNMAVAAAGRNIPSHNESSLVDTIASLYRRISEAQAAYKLDLVRDLMSKDQFRLLHLLMVRRQQGGWDKIDWRLEELDKLGDNIRLVQARLIKSSQDSPLEWLQFTYRISSKQRFAAYSLANKEVQLVAGDPDKIVDAVDYWVFEYKSRAPVNKQKQQEPGARWRLVGRLEV